jgi:hypothetical protein
MEFEKSELKLRFFFGCKDFRVALNAKNNLMEHEKPKFKLWSHFKPKLKLQSLFIYLDASIFKLLSMPRIS